MKIKPLLRTLGLVAFSFISLIGCDGCREDEYEVFNRVFPPCDVCTTVKIVNKQTGSTINDTSQTLRNVSDSLVIKQSGSTIVALANLEQYMADRKERKYYFRSVSSTGVKSIRFVLTGSGETPLITSQVMDGEYNPAIDTLDIYYKQR